MPFRRRFNLKKTNWHGYTQNLDATIKDIQPTAESYSQFIDAVRRAARKNIPRGCRRNNVPGLTRESAEMYEQYRHDYESDHFAEDTIEAGEELMNTISEERRKAWQTLIE